MAANKPVTRWTKYKGGKFISETGNIWKEYNAENGEVATFQKLFG